MIHKFKTDDCPDAKGKMPKSGDMKWTLSFILDNGMDYLEIEIGKKARNAFIRMLEQEQEDDFEMIKRVLSPQPVITNGQILAIRGTEYFVYDSEYNIIGKGRCMDGCMVKNCYNPVSDDELYCGKHKNANRNRQSETPGSVE